MPGPCTDADEDLMNAWTGAPTEEQLEQERKARLKLALKGERVLSVPCRFPAKEAAEAEERALEEKVRAHAPAGSGWCRL